MPDALPPMLKRIEAKIGEVRGFLMTVDAEDGAFP